MHYFIIYSANYVPGSVLDAGTQKGTWLSESSNRGNRARATSSLVDRALWGAGEEQKGEPLLRLLGLVALGLIFDRWVGGSQGR